MPRLRQCAAVLRAANRMGGGGRHVATVLSLPHPKLSFI